MENGGTVVQLAAVRKRGSGDNQQLALPGRVGQLSKRVPRALLQRPLEKEVPAGIAGEAELRQNEKPNPQFIRMTDQTEDFGKIIAAVGNLQSGAGRGDLDKTVLHRFSLQAVRLKKVQDLQHSIIIPVKKALCNPQKRKKKEKISKNTCIFEKYEV